MKNYLFLYISVAIAALGGLLSGYDTGVISGALLYINQSFNINSFMLGLLVSSVSLGAVIGALINGVLADKFGRKKILILTALIFMLGSIFCAISKSPLELVLARMSVGVAVGVVSFVCPLYLSEISPKEKRGQLVSFYQLAITLGILFSYLINYFCANLDTNWRAMLFCGAIPAGVLFIGMLFLKDTPRWLVLKNRINDARKILEKTSFNPDFEIEEIKKTLVKKEIKFSKKLIMPFVIGIGIMFAQIMTGINAIIYYAPVIFKELGFQSNKEVLFVTIFIGLINFLMTFVAIALVDKLGRKPLLYIGLSGMTISLIVLSCTYALNYSFMKYFAVVFCALYIVFFSMSLGPVGLLLISEVFPLEYRASAMSIAIVSN
ncbi:sugar porter family MFS transporter, partial [bacterium]|nr:sugar porter family MFS transporter [bacterium]